jgi:hypothetical protein
MTRLLVAAACTLTLVSTGARPARAQPGGTGSPLPPTERVACGAYEAVPGGFTRPGRPSRVSIQRKGRILHIISDYAVEEVRCIRATGGETADLLVRTFSGGAHCCETLHVFALGDTLQPLLDYDSGNAQGVQVRDLDGDGRPELLLGDDGLSYFDDLSYAASPRPLPLVACRADDRFQDCTAKFPALLRDELRRRLSDLHPPASKEELPGVEGRALGVLALAVLLGEEEQGVAAIHEAAPSDALSAWIERARPKVREWASLRAAKLKAPDKR